MRMFIGIKPNKNIIQEIINLQKELNVIGNYTNPNNIHLTLVFLGEIKEKDINKVKRILDKTNISRFNFEIEHLEMLRDIIILKVKDNEILNSLYNSLVTSLWNSGFEIEKRKYFPHITLVRKTSKCRYRYFSLINEVNAITLFSSSTINGKLVYESKYEVTLK